jgi:hypothetical protein
MIDKLRFAIDNTDNPKLLEILSQIAKLSDPAQEKMLELIESGVFTK